MVLSSINRNSLKIESDAIWIDPCSLPSSKDLDIYYSTYAITLEYTICLPEGKREIVSLRRPGFYSLSPDKKVLLCSAEDVGQIDYYKTNNDEERTLNLGGWAIGPMVWSYDGKYLAVGCRKPGMVIMTYNGDAKVEIDAGEGNKDSLIELIAWIR